MKKDNFYGMVDDIEERIRKDEEKRFSSKVLEEARRPQNMGRIEHPDCMGSMTGPCGDTMEFSLIVEGGKITDIRFVTDGCGSSVACGSITTKMVKGRTLEGAKRISAIDILKELGGLPEENRHCAKLATEALQRTIRSYHEKER